MSRPFPFLVAVLCALAMVASAAHAEAGKRSKRRHGNMPDGWSWPPSEAMRRAARTCHERLDSLGVRWRKGPETPKVAAPVVIPDMKLGGIRLVSIYRKPPFVMDCHLAVAVAEQAPALYALGVRELRFSSIHRHTQVRVNGTQRASLSRHALGLAMDVWKFVDDAGVVHSVEDDYLGGDELLLAVEQAINDSGAFRLLLTPDNDPISHHDHFHFEAKVDYTAPARRNETVPARASRSGSKQTDRTAKKGTAKKGTAKARAVKKSSANPGVAKQSTANPSAVRTSEKPRPE